MRISFHVPGNVYDETVEQLVQDSSVLAALDGWRYEGGNMYNYIAMELVDQSVVGGTIRAAWMPDRGLEVVTDFWVPDTLHPSYINQLSDETIGQLGDGIGEGGFKISLGGHELVLVADIDNKPTVELVYDGVRVPSPSKIARAARDGNIRLLEDALASGEAIDSTLPGNSGLQL